MLLESRQSLRIGVFPGSDVAQAAAASKGCHALLRRGHFRLKLRELGRVFRGTLSGWLTDQPALFAQIGLSDGIGDECGLLRIACIRLHIKQLTAASLSDGEVLTQFLQHPHVARSGIAAAETRGELPVLREIQSPDHRQKHPVAGNELDLCRHVAADRSDRELFATLVELVTDHQRRRRGVRFWNQLGGARNENNQRKGDDRRHSPVSARDLENLLQGYARSEVLRQNRLALPHHGRRGVHASRKEPRRAQNSRSFTRITSSAFT